MSEQEVQEAPQETSTPTQEEHHEVEIVEEKENIIFNRKEIKGIVKSAKSTPSKKYLISYLSSKYKMPEEHIDLRYILNKPKRRESEFFALIYSKPIKQKEEVDNNG